MTHIFEDNGIKNSLKRDKKRTAASKAFQAVFPKEGMTVAGEVFINEVTSPWPIWRKERLWSTGPGRVSVTACILQSWLASSLALLPDFLMEAATPAAQSKTSEDIFLGSAL